MKRFDELIQAYTASDFDLSTVQTWYAENFPSGEMLSALAEHIGAEFLSGRIDFNAANGLLNRLMSLAGFESAPSRFWQYYIAFEDSETSNDPDTHAKAAISAFMRSGVA